MDTIAHIAIANFYKEGMGYQENILPIKHMEMGYNVVMITCNPDESIRKIKVYTNTEGLKVFLLPKRKNALMRIPIVNCMIDKITGLLQVLEEVQPNIIFMHGLQAVDNLDVIKYIRDHPSVSFYVDQHADYYNTPIKTLKQYITQKIIYKRVAKKLEPYVIKFWGVTPWRVKYLRDVYGLPEEKTDLLVMGGDERYINWEERENIRRSIRKEHNIPIDAFVIITGGKINKEKNTHLLLEAAQELQNNNLYIIVFGNFDEEALSLCKPYMGPRVVQLGWIPSKSVYNYYMASDLSVFPGTHSVLWEQSCACGLPGIFKDWEGGFAHVDVGGNAILLKTIEASIIEATIRSIIADIKTFAHMKSVAESKARIIFSYTEIAKRAIGFQN